MPCVSCQFEALLKQGKQDREEYFRRRAFGHIYQDGSFSWHCCLNFGRLKTSGLGILYISVCFINFSHFWAIGFPGI